MKGIASASSLSLLAVFLPTANFAQDEAPPAERVICHKEYRIAPLDGGNNLGTFGIKAVFNEAKGEIEIVERATMEYAGQEVDYESTVIYTIAPSVAPIRATAQTRVDGKVCMVGSITFSEGTYDSECTGFLNKRTGDPIDPPSKYVHQGEPLPQGTLIFQSALLAIGPRFLPGEGEMGDVVFVEFPDDIGAPELITFKSDYRLVREAADESGEFRLSIYSPHFERSRSSALYDRDDRLVSIALFGKMKLIEEE